MILIKHSIPIYSVSNLNTIKIIWSNYSSFNLRLVDFDKSQNYDFVPEIEKLIRELIKIQEVKRVRAIAANFPDIHWIDFQLDFGEANTDLSDEIWNKIQDLVIDYEWKLIDNSAQEWYFRPQIVDRFYSLKDQVIADSDKKQHNLADRLKIWSSNSPKWSIF